MVDAPPRRLGVRALAAAVAPGLFTVAIPHRLASNLDHSSANLVAVSLDDLSLSDALARASHRSDWLGQDSAQMPPNAL